MLWDPQGTALMAENFRRAKIAAEADRMREAEQRLAMLEDDWEDILVSALLRRYKSAEVRRTLRDQVTTEHNVLKHIASDLSAVYKWGATRELADPAQNAIAQELWRECRVDERLAAANLRANVVRDIGLRPRVVDGRMTIDIILPDRTTVAQHPDDPTQAVAVWTERTLSNTPGWTQIERIYLDAGQIRRVDQHGRVLGQEPGYGRVPIVWVHADERIDTFWGGTAFRDVYKATISVGCDMFKLDRMLHFQSELQPTYSGNPRDVVKGLAIAADKIWAAPGQFGVLNLQGDPNALLTTIKTRVGWIASQYGIAADAFDLSMQAGSGLQLRLRRLPLEQVRAAQIKVWRRLERELLVMMALVSQREHPLYKLDPIAATDWKQLNFHEEPLLEDPATQNRIWNERIKLGVMSEVDVLMEIDPDLTRDQAKERLARVRAEREEHVGLLKRMNMKAAPDATAPGAMPEANGRAGVAAKAAEDAQDPEAEDAEAEGDE